MYQPFQSFSLNGPFISVIGSGGKTTLLRYLAEILPGRVILTTSTHIFPFAGIPLVETGSEQTLRPREVVLDEIRHSLSSNKVICIGQMLSSGKLSAPTGTIPFEELSSEADYVVVEADGSARHPLKAHRPWEPVIPSCTSATVCVVGASGIGKPAEDVCHCPDLFCSLAGISPQQNVSEEHIAAVLNHENLADCYLINQIDTLSDPGRAIRLCRLIHKDSYMCSLSNLIC